MKILLINNLHQRRGGADIVYLNTGALLEAEGYEVCYFSMHSDDEEACNQRQYFAPDPKIVGRVKGAVNYIYNIEAARYLEKLLIDEKPDIACVHLMWGGLSPSIIEVLHQHGVPVVHVVHDYRMICPAYTFRRPDNMICEDCKGGKFYHCLAHKCSKGSLAESGLMTLEMYLRQWKNNPVKTIDGFIFVSQFCRDKHIEFDRRFEDIPNTVLYNCATIETTTEERGDYFLFYGRLSHEKGVMTLLQSISQTPGIKYRIVGTGPLEQQIKDVVRQKRLTNVELLGYRTGEELKNLVRKSRFVIVPSEWYENNPMTIVEAYAVGTPVIGARIGGIPEIVQDESTGFLFESGYVVSLTNTINKANELTDAQYASLSSECQTFASENFNQETYVTKLIIFLNEVYNKYNS